MSDKEITVQVLGRLCRLGQLYNAATASLINISLFTKASMEPPVTTAMPVPRTEVEYKLVKTAKERNHLLNVSVSVSVSILGGAAKMKGFGSYLDRSDSSEESTSVCGLVRNRTVHERIDFSVGGGGEEGR